MRALSVGRKRAAALAVVGFVAAAGAAAYPVTRKPSSATLAACPRNDVGGVLQDVRHLSSEGGKLELSLSYQTRVDESGNRLYCYMAADGTPSPTLHLNPGDRLVLHLRNDTPAIAPTSEAAMKVDAGAACLSAIQTSSSTNVHYHGANVAPTCHGDDVLHTLVNAGESFTYEIAFPKDEPPGIYWYHPHVHGLAESAVLGGASGLIVIEGLQNVAPAVAALPERFLAVRDNLVPGGPAPGGDVPSWDLSVNYHPVPYPEYKTPVVRLKPGARELWRLANMSADTILDVQLVYDGVAQPLQIIAIDAVPTGTDSGGAPGDRRAVPITRTHFLMAPAARIEFVVNAPATSVSRAELVTLRVDTGPDGDNDPPRPLVRLEPTREAPPSPLVMPAVDRSIDPSRHYDRFRGLLAAVPARQRVIAFSEVLSDPANPASPTNFYVTEDGAVPTLFLPSNPPAITVKQGAVEDWVIENRSLENHEFHIHQIHFLLLEQNGAPVATSDRQYRDTIQVPYWSGTGPYPSVKVRMDFRGADVGDFVYHCHILSHEDGGMMATIRVEK